jgi:NADH-quinone oxidoreductase subunit H
VKDLDVGVFYALAVSSLSVIGVLMAGLGERQQVRAPRRAARRRAADRLRAAAAARGRRRRDPGRHDEPAGHRASQQQRLDLRLDGIGIPFILTQFIGFGLFLVASQAELTQTPFDMPVAESELVAGYMVEYTGLPLPLLLHRRVRHRVRVRRLAATLFLGGWALPASHVRLMRLLGRVVLFAKIMVVAFLMFWVRFTYPRLREGPAAVARVEVLIPLGS